MKTMLYVLFSFFVWLIDKHQLQSFLYTSQRFPLPQLCRPLNFTSFPIVKSTSKDDSVMEP